MPRSEVPAELERPLNARVLALLCDTSAHSDVAAELARATAPLGDVQRFCPDPAGMAYVLVATQGVVFGFAQGMRRAAFRLDPLLKERALASAGAALAEAGPEWVAFELFRDGWPAVDLPFWARKAYVFAREDAGRRRG